MKNMYHERKLLPFLLLLCLLLTACGSNSGTSTGPDGGVNWYALHIFSDHSGWALASRGIMHTQDSGNHWTSVTPSELTIRSDFASLTPFFLNTQSAWIATTGRTQYVTYGNKQKPEMAHVFHTANGGKTWQSSEIPDTANTYSDSLSGPGFVAGSFLPLTPFGENRRMISLNNIISTDGHNVWVTISCTNVHTGGGHEDYTNVYRRLWHSTDGGQSWNKAWENTDSTLNVAAAWASFLNTKMGLMSGAQPLDLFVTYDGQTWKNRTLPAQGLTAQDLQMSTLEPAALFTTSEGAVSLRTYERGAHYLISLYVTHNGGQSWQKAGLLEFPQYTGGGEQDSKTVHYLDSQHWLVSGESVLSRTDDAGKHWQTLQLPQGYHYIENVSFVSDQEGWGIGRSLSTNQAVSSRQMLTTGLIHTTDGGKTWEKVNYQIG
jgi:photosystem II stability/assembly factor-like uncharacterized protein